LNIVPVVDDEPKILDIVRSYPEKNGCPGTVRVFKTRDAGAFQPGPVILGLDPGM
jgi:hypothetical protein